MARERTELAWNRTGLAVLVCISVLLRRLWPLDRSDRVLALALIAAGAAVWGVSVIIGWQRRLPLFGAGDAVMSVRTARLLSLGTLVLAAAAFTLGLLSPR